jgi:hypothetical protein
MTSSPIRQKAFATPRDEEDAVQLLNASVDPVLARVKNDVMACRNAVANGQTVLISEQRGIPEEVILALGHHGDAFIGALRINMRDEISKLKDSRYEKTAAVGTQSKLELVGHQRINEDLAAAALVHRLHFQLQDQAQAQAVRLSRIWPKAYITETDVPASAEFQVRHILNALRSIDRDFMTSEARVMILSEMARNWLGVLNDCLKNANSELSSRGWLPELNKQDIISWRRHINRMAGVNDAAYGYEKKQSTPQADVETESEPVQPEHYAPSRPVSSAPMANERVGQQPTSSISPIRRPESFSALEYARPANSFTRNEHAQFQPNSSLHAEYNDSTTVAEWADAFTGPSSVEIGQRFQRAIQSSLLPLPQQEINFAEPLLSHLQVVIKDYEKPVLLDTASIVKKEAVRRGADDVSDALVQRLVAAQNMMRTLMADESIPREVKIILVKLQLPWTRYLLQSGDALANASDPFKDLLWRVCAIGRRSSAPENDGTAQMLRATIAYFDKATRIDEPVIQKALNFINLKWDDIRRKAKLVLSRAALSWQGSASIMEKRQSVKDEITNLIGEDNVPESFAAAISENIIPMLLLYGLKEHLSEHDQRRAQHAKGWAQHYIRLRLKTPLDEINRSELDSVYRKCLEMVQDAVGNNSRLEADQTKFLEQLAAARGEQTARAEVVATAPVPIPEPKIALATVIKPELPVSTDQPPCTLDFMEKAKSMAIGSWLIANYEGHTWRGRIAARIKFKDSVIISDRNGGKLAEMTHQEFGHHLEKGHIKLIEDASSFSRALESMVMSVRQYNAV